MSQQDMPDRDVAGVLEEHWERLVQHGTESDEAEAERPTEVTPGEWNELIELLAQLHGARQMLRLDSSDAGPPWAPSEELDELVGQEFTGTDRFTIQSRLGSGGMGVVYQAWDRQREALVALKTLQRVSPAAISRLKQEFRVLTDLVHPNLVTLYDLFSESGQWFFTMELVRGIGFLDYVRRGVHLDLAQTERWPTPEPAPTASFRPVEAGSQPSVTPLQLVRLRRALVQLVEGLHFLHQAGKLHRDVKPSNVLVTAEGRLMLLDFGLATDAASQRSRTVALPYILGTAAYMSPEQAAGSVVGPASDWYAVGAMLYRTLTGTVPFVGSPIDVLREKQRQEPIPPSERIEGVPDDLDELCVSLLRRKPEARPVGAELLAQLRRSVGTVVDPQSGSPGAPTQEQMGASRKDDRAERKRWKEEIAERTSGKHVLQGEVPLVGRQSQLAALQEAFNQVCEGRVVEASVHGRSGAGKSALVSHFLNELEQDPAALVLRGRCYERESVPFKGVDSLIDDLSRFLRQLTEPELDELIPDDVRALARLFPVLLEVPSIAARPPYAETDDIELRQRAIDALRIILARLGARWPVVVAIDDLQWGDADSAVLLEKLLRAQDAPPLLLIASYRSEDLKRSPFLQTFYDQQRRALGTGNRREIAVAPLSFEESRQLALQLLDGDVHDCDSRADEIASEAKGSPYFVIELARHARQEKHHGRQPSVEGSAALDDVLWRRVSALSGAAQRLLELVAVGARLMRQDDVFRAAQLGGDELIALKALHTATLVRTTGPQSHDAIECYHDHIRETVVRRLPAEALRERHQLLGEALEQSTHDDPEALTEHFQSAEVPEKAAAYAVKAAARADQSLAFDRAARFYQTALELGQWDNERTLELRRKLADALANAGRGGDAARWYLAAEEQAQGALKLQLRQCAAEQLLQSGRFDQGVAVLREVLQEAGYRWPRTSLGAAMALSVRRAWLRWRGYCFRERDAGQITPEALRRLDVYWAAAEPLSLVDSLRAMALFTHHTLIALRLGEPLRITRVFVVEAHLICMGRRKRVQLAESLQEKAQEIAERLGDGQALVDCQRSAGYVALALGDWKRGFDLLDTLSKKLRADRVPGSAWPVAIMQIYTAYSLYYLGELRELGQRVPLRLQEAEDRGNLFLSAYLRGGVNNVIWLAADDTDRARQELDRAVREWPPHTNSGILHYWNILPAELQIELYTGDGVTAWRRINKDWWTLAARLQRTNHMVAVDLHNLRARSALAAIVSGMPARPLLRAARREANWLARGTMRSCEPLAELIRAGIADFERDEALAAERYERAARLCDAADMAMHAAAARRRRGALLGGSEGDALIAAADRFFQQQDVRNPARLAWMLAPTPQPVS